MPPSCCKDKLGNPAETYATTASRPDEVSPPVSKLEVEDTCCTRDQVEPIAQTEAQKPVEHTKIVSPCVKCGDSSNPGQPCCDETCLVRIAVRECEDSCGSDGDFASTSSGYRDSGKGDDCCAKAVQSAKTKKGPCQRHMESAKSRFQPTLDALGCICRALFALNLESCCVKGQDSQRESRRSSARISSPHRLSAISLERAKGGGCCSVASPDPYKKPIEPDCKKGCCGRAMDSSCGNSILSTSCAKKCCSETSKQAIIRATSDNCCSGNSCSEEKEMSGAVASEVHLDLEKGILDGEHVVLSIQGMTCTGCETKLERTLANIPGISKIKTSLVLARAEFDVSTAQISVDEAVVRLQKATGFECQKLSRDGHELEILPPGISEKLLEPLPPGVLSINPTTDATFRIAYDPQVLELETSLKRLLISS